MIRRYLFIVACRLKIFSWRNVILCQINQILRVIVEESVHNIRNDQCTLMTIDLCEDDFQFYLQL